MCGILGLYTSDLVRDYSSIVNNALSAISHRGPDDKGAELFSTPSGNVVLGHTRLSIIDLSAAGHQPMHSENGDFVIVFNGEIYNYRELREELRSLGCHFFGDSDTEVLLAAWVFWGEKSIHRFTGMFAFAIYDKVKRKLFFVRDCFGIKPFFIAKLENGICFSSELPSILQLLNRSVKLNYQVAYDYLIHGDYDSKETTFIDGVDQLAPGSIQVFDMDSGTLEKSEKWWTPSVVESSILSFASAAEQLRDIFLNNVKLHLRSDVKLGAALSGGVDSSAIVCAMRKIEPEAPIHTFSFLAKGSPDSEESWVKLVNEHIGADAHSVEVEPTELARDLDDMIVAQGEPFLSTSIYAQYRVFKLARENGVKVVLDGQGADELLAGYRGYPGKRVRSLIETGRYFDAISFLTNWSKWPNRSLAIGLKASVAEFAEGDIYQLMRSFDGGVLRPEWLNVSSLSDKNVVLGFPKVSSKHYPKGRCLVAELAHSCTRRGLPAYLRHADRNSMRFSVESRVPFLTKSLAEFAFSLPENYLVSPSGETKHVFKEAMRGIVPDQILDRRDKVGFSTPEMSWLIALAPQVRVWLAESDPVDFIIKDQMLLYFDSVVSGKLKFTSQVWRLINFCRWYSKVFMPLTARH